MIWLGIDTGGTFTDFVLLSADGVLRCHKRLSTPSDPSIAVQEGVRFLLQHTDVADITYGSTVATNALLERKGARVGFVSNKGFEDMLQIARQTRSALYALRVEKMPTLAAANYGIQGRLGPHGELWEPLSTDSLPSLIEKLRDDQIESVAICLLHSYANGEHEEALAAALAETGLPISVSHRLFPEYREYERAVVTTVNAYVSPKMSAHLSRLAEGLAGQQVRVMLSNGGTARLALAAEEPVRTVLSGPAGGVMGAWWSGLRAGHPRVIAFDMGGTSTDVSLCAEEPQASTEGSIIGLPLRLPMLDVHTVGAGGGSVVWLDLGGALQVGPQSAGSQPGPACYGRGGPATVTDAHAVLGRLDPQQALGGSLSIDIEAARAALAKYATPLGMSVETLAEGVLRLADVAMEKAIRVISVERGLDPRGFALLSFGGCGGLHACALASSLGMKTVVVPAHAGVLSAFGMLVSPVQRDVSQSLLQPLSTLTEEQLAAARLGLLQQVEAALGAEGFAPEQISLQCDYDVRYRGQAFELRISETSLAELPAAFAVQYQQRYGYTLEGRELELVTLRLRASARHPMPSFPVLEMAATASAEAAYVGTRRTWVSGTWQDASVYERSRLLAGMCFDGPAILVEEIATTWVAAGWRAVVQESGAVLLVEC